MHAFVEVETLVIVTAVRVIGSTGGRTGRWDVKALVEPGEDRAVVREHIADYVADWRRLHDDAKAVRRTVALEFDERRASLRAGTDRQRKADPAVLPGQHGRQRQSVPVAPRAAHGRALRGHDFHEC